ncbi:hypothetical protein I79_001444 [Cricetulus griseus]|uniref:Uncharacterized protein n=1 Tax=Cricetulus griseus TaxID=10029 RepID=G3GUS1_CRIGR|nr:hypothetical protein I79_001444 [Cricetulus griseus]
MPISLAWNGELQLTHPGGRHSLRTPLAVMKQGILGACRSFRTHVPTVPAGLHLR